MRGGHLACRLGGRRRGVEEDRFDRARAQIGGDRDEGAVAVQGGEVPGGNRVCVGARRSTPITWVPLSSSAWARWEPMKPATPVTTTL